MKKIITLSFLILMFVCVSFGQKSTIKKAIFAVTFDGKSIEPIAFIEDGKLTEPIGGDADGKALADFIRAYYKPKSTYDLIFGGGVTGKVTAIKGNDVGGCGKNIGDVTTTSAKVKLKGLIMALATNAATPKTTKSFRRTPTPAERTELEKVIRAELTKNKVSTKSQKLLRYQNLTAVDINNDGMPEFIGSYWVSTLGTERALLFFIAEKDTAGKYTISQNSFQFVKQKDVMSGAIKDVDDGIYHELLLDIFDVDGDGSSEIFTVTQAFESNSFTVYSKSKDSWTKSFEGSNYHCGY
jgi:hypothetical protein